MRVAVFNADEQACGHYRLLWPAQVLQAQGHDVVISPALDAHRHETDLLGDMLVDVTVDADVAVFQRLCKRELVEAIPVLQRNGVAVVVEVDDDFHALPKGHPARRDFAPMHHPDRNWRWHKIACDLADLVTVSTPALAERYGAHGRVAVLPNCVPDRYLQVTGERAERVVVSWAGTPVTHTGDLEVVGDSVRRLVADTHASFRAIGSRQTLVDLDVAGEFVEWQPLLDGYPETIAAVDVAMVPLVDSAFTRAKSWLKGAEAAALGVPFVASPLPEYRKLHALGAGLLADGPGEWYGQLRRLVDDAGLRAEMAARGREVMAAWTYERRAGDWWGAWCQAAENRQEARAA